MNAPVPIEKRPDAVWTAAHTKARCEKVVARYCDSHSIAHYLPLQRRAKRYQRRTVETWIPMFPGYIFVQLAPEMHTILLQSHRIAAILPINATAEERLIEELRQIQRLEAAAREVELVVQPEIIEGKAVTVTAGPLRGVTGVVQRRLKLTRVVVNVDILGQSVAAELDIGEVTTEEA